MCREITDKLFLMQDKKYKDFNKKLIPNIDEEYMIGVRIPELRKYAREINKSDLREKFLAKLPHKYFEENNIHAFLIGYIKDFDKCINELERFFPYVNCWATCDSMNPNVLKKDKKKLYEKICEWVESEHTYCVRFAIKCLMNFYLDEDYDELHIELLGRIKSDEYYINMMISWYLATALAKQYDSVVKYFEQKKFSEWIHNKAIQKAIESRRVIPEHKEYLKNLKIKKHLQ